MIDGLRGSKRTEGSGQEKKEMHHEAKREVEKAKQNAYDELYERLDTKREKDGLDRCAGSGGEGQGWTHTNVRRVC